MSDVLRARLATAIERGESLNAIAKGAGINQPVLWRFLHSGASLRLDNADKLAAYFGLRLS